MKKRILTVLALIIVLVSGGVFIYHKLTKPDLGPNIFTFGWCVLRIAV